MATVGGRKVLAAGSMVLKVADEEATFEAEGITFAIRFDEDGGAFRSEPSKQESPTGGDALVITMFNTGSPLGAVNHTAFGRLVLDDRQLYWTFHVLVADPVDDAKVLTYTVSG